MYELTRLLALERYRNLAVLQSLQEKPMPTKTKTTVELSQYDLELIEQALALAAARLESYARFNPLNAHVANHESRASFMRKLRERLEKQSCSSPPQ